MCGCTCKETHASVEKKYSLSLTHTVHTYTYIHTQRGRHRRHHRQLLAARPDLFFAPSTFPHKANLGLGTVWVRGSDNLYVSGDDCDKEERIGGDVCVSMCVLCV